MAYPTLAPTSRSFSPGDYPIKTYQSQSGVETRILYGSKRTKMALELSYDNIADADAQSFADHYDETKGSYLTFAIPDAVRSGWSGAGAAIDAPSGNAWRYESAPQINQVRAGISSVKVNLIGVL